MQFNFVLVTGILLISVLVISGIHGQRKLANPCKHNQFRCSDGSRCLSSEKLCNKRKDCPQGEDESGSRQWDCSRTTLSTVCDSETEFKCRYGGCVPRSKICDGEPDCWGANDEATELCDRKPPTTTPRPRVVSVIYKDPLLDRTQTVVSTPPVTTQSVRPKPSQPPLQVSSNPPTTRRPVQTQPTSRPIPTNPGNSDECPPIDPDEFRDYKITCKDPFGQRIECSRSLPKNSKAIYKCKDYYEPPRNGITQTERTCLENGLWSRKRSNIVCILECGSGGQDVTGLVVGGTSSKKGKWPWHVALYREDPPNSGKYSIFCGGSLINEQTVLTAAHCVKQDSAQMDPRKIRVLLGKYFKNYNTRDDLVEERYVRDIAINDNYNYVSLSEDIALLWLDQPVMITQRVRPVCLPPRDADEIPVGMLGQLVGWGRTANGFLDDLQETKLPVVDSRVCKESHPTFVGLVRRYNFCAGYTNGTSACDGDSGGGLVFRETSGKKSWAILGIVSAGISRNGGGGGCEPKYYSVFTKVSEYRNWIEREIDRFKSLR